MKHIVIVGGGFGGVKLAIKLSTHKEFKITLISDNDNFEYHAALYRSATGWSPNEVNIPLVDIFEGRSRVKVIKDKIKGIDGNNQRIKSASGKTYHYDELVMAVGQVANYYGIEGLEEKSFSLNTAKDAFDLRGHIKQIICKNTSDSDALEFVVIGGGATGVELASELKFFIKQIYKTEGIRIRKINITLVEGSARLLSILSPKASTYARWRLKKLGINVMLSTKVVGLKDDKLIFGKGNIKAKTVIWTAGATNNPIFAHHKRIFTIARNSRVEVDEHLMAYPHVYVIGDSANTAFAGMAQTALSDAVYLAKNFIRRTKKQHRLLYSPPYPIYAVPIGSDFAVVQWGTLVLRGKLAWYLRRIADFKLFVTFEPYKKAIKSWRAGNKRAKGF